MIEALKRVWLEIQMIVDDLIDDMKK